MTTILQPLSTVYVQPAGDQAERLLYTCRLLDDTGAETTLAVPLHAGLTLQDVVFVFHEELQRFLRRAARVVEIVEDSGGGQRVKVEFLGSASDTNQRKHHRIACQSVGLTATLADEADCEVVDISAGGIGVLCFTNFAVRQTLPVTMRLGSKVYAGEGLVASVREISDRRLRYGIRSNDVSMSRALTAIGLEVIQRQVQSVTPWRDGTP